MKRNRQVIGLRVRAVLCAVLASLSMLSGAADLDATGAAPKQTSIKILLVGNSFLRWNNLPDRIQTYFAENFPGLNVSLTSNIVDGRTIQAALDASASQTLLSSCDWEVAIVQGRNGLTWRVDGQTKWMPPDAIVATTQQLHSPACTMGSAGVAGATSTLARLSARVSGMASLTHWRDFPTQISRQPSPRLARSSRRVWPWP